VGVVVGEGAEAVEFFLARGVPERELNVDIVYEDVWRGAGLAGGLNEVVCAWFLTMDVVLEDCGLVDCWEVSVVWSLTPSLVICTCRFLTLA
jgi:hypothetical protein